MERVEPLTEEPDFERTIDPRRRTQRTFPWPLIAAIIAIAIAAVFAWRAFHEPAAPVPAPAAPAPAATATPPAAPASPHYPIDAAVPSAAESAPLPAIGDSDAPLQDLMASIFAGAPLDRIFHLEQIVPRFVATIDNLPRQTVALSRMSVNPIGGSVETSQADGRMLLRADNAQRYAMYVRVMEQADTGKLVAAYVRYYPLFQKAYEDLGYPHGYFNDRLVEVIDHLLATPDVPAPIALAAEGAVRICRPGARATLGRSENPDADGPGERSARQGEAARHSRWRHRPDLTALATISGLRGR